MPSIVLFEMENMESINNSPEKSVKKYIKKIEIVNI